MRSPAVIVATVLAAFGAASALAQEVPVPKKRPDIEAPAAESAPPPAPPSIRRSACPALLAGHFKGKLAPPLSDGECGEHSPVEMEAVGKVQLSGKPTVNCAMATEFAAIIETAGALSREMLGTELRRIETGPGYECRHRNRGVTGKLSEHGYANAIDIVALELSDGRKVSVEKDWPHLPQKPKENSGEETENDDESVEADDAKRAPVAERASTPEANFLAKLHEAACKRFTTVLGPDANADHHAHFHFDLGCHGRDCTYLICE